MNSKVSIFDGWTRQSRCASAGESSCAIIFLIRRHGMDFMQKRPDITERLRAVSRWIVSNMEVPELRTAGINPIIWANDSGQLDIDGFRTVEKLVTGYVPAEQPEPAMEVFQ